MARRRKRAQAGMLAGCFGVVFGGIFMAAGGAVFYFLTIRAILLWQSAQSWPEVPCRVMASEVAEHRGDSTTYSINITYEYFFEGRPYTSHEYNFNTSSSSGYDGKAAVVAQYPPGLETVCYVNPDSPEQAVLNREWSNAYLLGGFGLIFFVVGLGVAIGMTRAASKASSSGGTRAFTPAQATLQEAVGTHDATPRILEPSTSPQTKFIAALIATVVIYLIVGGVGYGFLSDGFHFDDIIAVIVLGIFALVGLGMAVATVTGFLALWNPRVRLHLDPGVLRLGGTVTISWELVGDTSRLESLKIYLKGIEAATYRRGTTTSTDRVTFEKIPIAEAATNADVGAGRVQFAMPEFTMHSLELSNNKIEWSICVAGSIPKWPDVEEEFPVKVLPLPLPTSAHAGESQHA